jgi:hypothetical protein
MGIVRARAFLEGGCRERVAERAGSSGRAGDWGEGGWG